MVPLAALIAGPPAPSGAAAAAVASAGAASPPPRIAGPVGADLVVQEAGDRARLRDGGGHALDQRPVLGEEGGELLGELALFGYGFAVTGRQLPGEEFDLADRDFAMLPRLEEARAADRAQQPL
jgi:hypothetical protein